jgi:hypothetical protein
MNSLGKARAAIKTAVSQQPQPQSGPWPVFRTGTALDFLIGGAHGAPCPGIPKGAVVVFHGDRPHVERLLAILPQDCLETTPAADLVPTFKEIWARAAKGNRIIVVDWLGGYPGTPQVTAAKLAAFLPKLCTLVSRTGATVLFLREKNRPEALRFYSYLTLHAQEQGVRIDRAKVSYSQRHMADWGVEKPWSPNVPAASATVEKG